MRKFLFGLLVVCLVPATGWAQKRGLLPQDYYKMSQVSDVALAPAGDIVAFTVTTIVEKDNRRHREVWVQRLKNGTPDGVPTRFTDPTREASGPAWSPDGSLLSFTSQRSGDRNGTWFVRLVPPSGEAFHIDGVEGAPVWSADGKWIAYLKEPGENAGDDAERNKRDGWIAPGAISRTLDPKRFDGHVVTSTRTKRDGTLTLLGDPSVRRKNQLFVVPAAGGTPKQVTSASYAVRSVIWAADGQTLLFTADESEDDEYSSEPLADIYTVSVNGGAVRKLTTNPGSETAPALSPKGDRLVFAQTRARGGESDLMLVDVAADGTFKGAPRNLTASWDDDPGEPMWAPDGNAVRFDAGISGDAHLFEVSLQGAVRQVTTGERHLGSFSRSRDGSIMAYTVNSVFHPAEAFVARADGSGERKLTTFNDSWLAGVTIVPPEQLTWKVADGTTIEGWLVKPLNYTPGKKYPLVLKIHGGPHGAYGTGWFDTFQILAGSGMFVLYPNPRGSTGYGHKFTYATRGKWGEMDQEDFLKGIDTAMAKYADIDGRRLGVSGGSYGGFMTNWLTARTDRFAAAVTSRSITTWESWYGSSDAQGLTEYEFLGKPWEQRELYRRLSPISYVENVKAPTLIIAGEEDYRTPMTDNEQWFMALKKRKVPVELVRYPRSSHGLSRNGEPWLLVDRLERIRSWFVHYLVEQPASTTSSRQ
jgi:dipeptidyl aminopeptidase/acylaminoacyl peptidase